MVLSPRIKAILNAVDENRVADIGTDHAVLAIELAKNNKKVIATDISPKCIEKALKNIARAGIDNIETRVGDGLQPINQGEIDIAVIAGMGAREIIKIISEKNVCDKFILVPHQDTELLRKFINENGFFAVFDEIVFSEGKFYSIIYVKRGKGNYLPHEIFIGKNTTKNNDFVLWCESRLKRLRNIYKKQTEKTVLEEIVMLEKSLNKITVSTIEAIIEEIAPKELAMEGDNVGLLLGNPQAEVKSILVTLDVTPEVVDEAVNLGANLIVSHHPVMFHPINNLVINTPEKTAIHKAIKNDISIISAHTNFDFANGGLNDYLMIKLNIVVARVIKDDYLRIGQLKKPLTAKELAEEIGGILSDKVRVIGENKLIKTVAVMCGGAGHDYKLIDRAFLEGADCYISGDVRYDAARYIADQKKTMLVFGHFESEILFIEHMQKLLLDRGLNINIYRSAENSNPYTI